MKNSLKKLKHLILAVYLMIWLSFLAGAQPNNYTTAKAGNWNVTTTWTGGVVPNESQYNLITITHTVTITSTISINNSSSIVTISGNGNLVMNADITGKGKFNFVSNVNTLTINSGATFNPWGGDGIFGNIIINGGTFNPGSSYNATMFNGSITMNGGSFKPFGGTISGPVTLSNGASFTRINNNNPVIFNGSVTVDVGCYFESDGWTFNGIVTMNGRLVVVGNIYINNKFTIPYDVSFGGANVYVKAPNGELAVKGYTVSGGSLNIENDAKLILSGILINNGTLTVQGDILLQDGGSTTGSPFSYYPTGTLIYMQTKSFTVGNEWKATINGIVGVASPMNVVIQMAQGTTLTLPSADRVLPGDLSILSGGLILTTNNLTIGGNWTKDPTATFDAGTSTIYFNGSGAQPQIITSPKSESKFYNLINNNISGALQFSDSVGISNQLTLSDKSTTIIGDGSSVSFKSGANGTANLGQIGTGATIKYVGTGGFVVERFLANHKAWHFLSVPTLGSTFNTAWQEGNAPLQIGVNLGYGTMLTGTKGTFGYDYTSPQPSLKYFDNNSNTYVEVSNTSNAMVSTGGYMVFIRGDRRILPTDSKSFSSTTLRTKGKIYTPSAPPAPISVLANKWALIGNPYPSAIDFSKLSVTGGATSLGTYYIWDPNLTSGTGATQYGLGAFRTISGSKSVPSSGNYVDGSIPPIQSGQAFFVKNPSANATITVTIPETAKINTSSVKPFKTGSSGGNKLSGDLEEEDASLRGNLYGFSGSTPVLLDGVLSLFRETYNNEFDAWDAEKLNNLNTENMGISSKGRVLAIERKKLPENGDTIFYRMNNYKIASYRFELIVDKLDVSGQDAFLFDKYLNLLKPINPNDTTIYDFDIKSPAGSWDENRFSILFKTTFTTPVTFTSIKAYTQNKDIVVEWKVENESNMRSYTVETSSDGNTFTKGGTVAARNVAATSYQWLDVNVGNGYHYYRILSTELDGKTSYSKIVRVLVGNNRASKITIYPNPIKGGVINLQFENQEAGVYQLRLLNTVGQVMMSKTISHPGGSSSELLMLNTTIAKGIYQLEIMKGNVRVSLLSIKN
ncbi:MAG: T9SS type A sorting domain-containing protein [Ginsengibacter sp.]